MKTLRKINLSRLDLSTKEVARERPFVNVSFHNKKHIFFEIEPDNADGLTGLFGRTAPELAFRKCPF